METCVRGRYGYRERENESQFSEGTLTIPSPLVYQYIYSEYINIAY